MGTAIRVDAKSTERVVQERRGVLHQAKSTAYGAEGAIARQPHFWTTGVRCHEIWAGVQNFCRILGVSRVLGNWSRKKKDIPHSEGYPRAKRASFRQRGHAKTRHRLTHLPPPSSRRPTRLRGGNRTIAMNDEQLLRYSRQILLPQVDVDGQQTLLDARALIIGVGGLGSPAAMYLAAAGVGTLVVCDDDRVDLSNLQRQIAHHSDEIGLPKVDSAQRTLLRLNPEIKVIPIPRRLSSEELAEEARRSHVVLDCSDNFHTRFLVNAACVAARTPLVSGAVIRFEGQVAVFDSRCDQSPCYQCLFPDEPAERGESCARNGVAAPVPGIIGSVQAVEALKLLLGAGRTLTGRLLLLDALNMDWTTLRIRKHPRCPICSEPPRRETSHHAAQDLPGR